MPVSRPVLRNFAIACALVAIVGGYSQHANAQNAALPIGAAKLATALPAAAWGDVTRQQPKLEDETSPMKRSVAKVAFTGPRGSKEAFLAEFTISDEGANGAKMYEYGANYLKEDVKAPPQHTLVLPGGRRALLTGFTATSMEIETFVASRFVVKTHCINATEAQCVTAFSKHEFAAIEALKPRA